MRTRSFPAHFSLLAVHNLPPSYTYINDFLRIFTSLSLQRKNLSFVYHNYRYGENKFQRRPHLHLIVLHWQSVGRRLHTSTVAPDDELKHCNDYDDDKRESESKRAKMEETNGTGNKNCTHQ